MLSGCNFLESEQTVPDIDAVSTGAELKEHSILKDLAISDMESLLQLASILKVYLALQKQFKGDVKSANLKPHSCHAKE